MAQSKVPKFGAWEGGENYTAYFENARQNKNNGQIKNPNDPEQNPALFPQNDTQTQNQTPPTQTTAEPQGVPSKVPQFGAWDNGDNVGYTMYFENARNTKAIRPSKPENKGQPHAPMAKHETQEAQTKVPQFGDWNEGKGGSQYTAYFENARKNMSDGLGDVGDRARPKSRSEERVAQGGVGSRVPQFGDWNEGDGGSQYTAYFDNARKNKSDGLGDVGDRAQPKSKSEERVAQGGVGSRSSEQRSTKEEGFETPARHGRQTPGSQTPQHPKGGNKSQLKPVGRGSNNSEKGAAIPQFGVWNTDPSQAEGFTGAFKRAREDRMTPPNKSTPASFDHQPQQSDQPKKGCCCPWF